ncbi:hypothetical protein OOK60_07075 [Trichothermofontia sichuanensis B231]|uniref:hypothetical protein n=1 Tax=Trichothermofontia sichuanensis TaxID=3045816 RepID=UPI00224672D5|nr:hypothetical protein [Trichothermofontia sichuanensis]UZQ55823.1 hypothetical protein OOK60_07075 [Trichothermofontia sichuanensis B231]
MPSVPAYEELLAEYSNRLPLIALLREYRPYLEMLPSLRRPAESLIPIPLPLVKAQLPQANHGGNASPVRQAVRLPCDVGIVLCDPDWKVKTGVEIFLFIHRPGENFSDLLGRWRQTQVWLSYPYEWIMPLRYRHIFSEGTDAIYPLFILLADTPEHIHRGLKGARLPVVVRSLPATTTMGDEDVTLPNHEDSEASQQGY